MSGEPSSADYFNANSEAIAVRDAYDGTRKADNHLVETLLIFDQFRQRAIVAFRENIACCLTQKDGDWLAGIDTPSQPPLAEQYLQQALDAYEDLLRSATSVEQLAQQQGIPFQPLHFQLVDTKDQPGPIIGSGEGRWEIQFVQRLQTLILALRSIRIFKDDLVFHQEQLRPDQMREAPYVLVRIPRSNKAILVSSQVGEATFVISGVYVPGLKKEEIVENGGRRIVHRTDEQWTGEILQALRDGLHPPLAISSSMWEPEYFTQQNMLLDLESYARSAGLSSSVELTTGSSLGAIAVICANGERVKFQTYLRRACITLNLTSHSNALKYLKHIAGCLVPVHCEMDARYFSNPTYVREDLISYAIEMGLNSLADLSTNNVSVRVRCINGEVLTLQTYLCLAGQMLGFGKTREQAGSRKAAILTRLKETAGYKAERIYCDMNQHYFSNPTHVREDLLSCAIRAGAKSIEELTTISTYMGNDVRCMNGETIQMYAYLNRAGIALEFGANAKETNSHRASILRKLKLIAGCTSQMEYIKMDELYFKNREYITEDLTAFAKAAGLQTIENLRVMRKAVSAQCCNTENVSFLDRAGVGLGFCSLIRESCRYRSAILQRLKEIARTSDVAPDGASHPSSAQPRRVSKTSTL
jgi:hypothetical protein